MARLEWFESKAELPKNEGRAVLHAIARDRQGRKFTNCTSLELDYKLSGEGAYLLKNHIGWKGL